MIRPGDLLSLRGAFAAILLLAALPGDAQSSGAPTPIIQNGDFETGAPGDPPPHWGGSEPGGSPAGAGYRSAVDRDRPNGGTASARLEWRGETPPPPGKFGSIGKAVAASDYRGKRIRLRAAARARDASASHVGLWLRVDRPGGQRGAFAGMDDRPIRSTSWADYELEVDVADDAEQILFGLVLAGHGAAWLDDVRLDIIGPARTPGRPPEQGVARPRSVAAAGDEPARALTPPGLDNLKAFARLYGYVRHFHPSDEAAAADWDSVAIAGVQRVEPANSPAELAAALNALFKPLAPTVEAFVTGRPPAHLAASPAAMTNGGTAIRWQHRGMGEERSGLYKSAREPVAATGTDDVLTIDLPGGVSARIPIVAWRDASGKTMPTGTAPPRPAKPAGFTPAGFDRATRLAAIVSGWNVLHHFYPYFDAVEVDWAAELDRGLNAAAVDEDDLAFLRTLRRLIAALRDGHGHVGYPTPPRGQLPIAWEVVEGRLVVTAVDPAVAGIARGDIVTHVDNVPASEALAGAAALFSGSRQWVGWRAASDLLGGPPGREAVLRIDDRPSRDVRLVYRPSAPAVAEAKPPIIGEIRPGILYVDIGRASEAEMRAHQQQMAAAKALIFDLRGYPRGTPWYLPHLTERPIASARMEIPLFLKPDRSQILYAEGGWKMAPSAPRFTANVAFITNGSAISYAESVLGTVKGNGLAEIVGEATAGANGNVAAFTLPGGYRIAWTGMRVLNQDGSRHHVVGVQPTIPASRTIEGVRAGRDELLEKAVEVVATRMRGTP